MEGPTPVPALIHAAIDFELETLKLQGENAGLSRRYTLATIIIPHWVEEMAICLEQLLYIGILFCDHRVQVPAICCCDAGASTV